MTRQTGWTLGLALLVGAACNEQNLIDPCSRQSDGICVDDQDGGGGSGRGDGGGAPGTITSTGPGTGTPFDPKGDGSGGVKLNPNGEVVLDPGAQGTTQPVIWVANSSEGTVSKVDTRTMKEIGRYYTFPGGQADPSRTTVSLGGDVVVANRAWTPDPARASATKIAGDLSGCVDRNGNGKIDTFQGAGAVPSQFVWQAGQANSPDECVLWMTPLRNAGGTLVRPRAAGFNAEVGLDGSLSTQVYIGLYDPKQVVRLDGKTGKELKRIDVPLSPYGLVLDRDGNVWVRGDSNAVIKIDPKAGDAITAYGTSPCPYGITADAQGRIYTAGGACLARLDPTTKAWEQISPPGASSMRGVAVDQNNQVWVAETSVGMYHIDGSKSPMTYVNKVTISGGNNVGAAIDFDGLPWVISLAQSTAFKVDPKTHTAQGVPVGNGPYTYSDMTGFQLRNVAPTGVFRKTFVGCANGTQWVNLDYDMLVPAGSQVTVRVRSATTAAGLDSAMWQQVAVVPSDKPPFKLSAPTTNNYLQVEFNLRSGDAKITPILSAIRVGYNCILG